MKTYRFTAEIHAGPGEGAYVLFPYDVKEEFGTTGRVPVRATFDGVPYSGSLTKYGDPQHMLGILKAILRQIGKAPATRWRLRFRRTKSRRRSKFRPSSQRR